MTQTGNPTMAVIPSVARDLWGQVKVPRFSAGVTPHDSDDRFGSIPDPVSYRPHTTSYVISTSAPKQWPWQVRIQSLARSSGV